MSSPRTLLAAFGAGRLVKNRPLAPLTTFRIGGPADLFFDAVSTDDLVLALRAAAADGFRCTLLGGGSNLLISDHGIRGLVIRVRSSRITLLEGGLVQADAGVTINGLVRWTIREALTGLEAWAGTPGTVGGALSGNAHWAGRTISEFVHEVAVVGPAGDVSVWPASGMAFGYDTSRLQRSDECAIWATFRLTPAGDPEALRATARASLHYRKRTQPLRMPSAGCIFQNPVPGRDRLPDGMPWSAGALIDRAGLKGRAIGGARVSPIHANFIVNEGGATAQDVRQLIRLCHDEVRRQFAVELREEIVSLGSCEPASTGP